LEAFPRALHAEAFILLAAKAPIRPPPPLLPFHTRPFSLRIKNSVLTQVGPPLILPRCVRDPYDCSFFTFFFFVLSSTICSPSHPTLPPPSTPPPPPPPRPPAFAAVETVSVARVFPASFRYRSVSPFPFHSSRFGRGSASVAALLSAPPVKMLCLRSELFCLFPSSVESFCDLPVLRPGASSFSNSPPPLPPPTKSSPLRLSPPLFPRRPDNDSPNVVVFRHRAATPFFGVPRAPSTPLTPSPPEDTRRTPSAAKRRRHFFHLRSPTPLFPPKQVFFTDCPDTNHPSLSTYDLFSPKLVYS